MTNLKKMALGLLVAVLAVGFSAFTSKSASSKFDPQWVYVQVSDDVYEQRAYGTYVEGLCIAVDEKPCAFIQNESDGTDHGPVLNSTTLTSIPSMEDRSQGLYDPQ